MQITHWLYLGGGAGRQGLNPGIKLHACWALTLPLSLRIGEDACHFSPHVTGQDRIYDLGYKKEKCDPGHAHRKGKVRALGNDDYCRDREGTVHICGSHSFAFSDWKKVEVRLTSQKCLICRPSTVTHSQESVCLGTPPSCLLWTLRLYTHVSEKRMLSAVYPNCLGLHEHDL